MAHLPYAAQVDEPRAPCNDLASPTTVLLFRDRPREMSSTSPSRTFWQAPKVPHDVTVAHSQRGVHEMHTAAAGIWVDQQPSKIFAHPHFENPSLSRPHKSKRGCWQRH
eukprot:1923511-Rhodomonas_salina.2